MLLRGSAYGYGPYGHRSRLNAEIGAGLRGVPRGHVPDD